MTRGAKTVDTAEAAEPPPISPQPPARVSKADQAHEQIRNRIVAGEFRPGSRLVLEKLARELGVSPVPVREAIRRLEAEGYVVFQKSRGATVATIDAKAYGESMQTLAILEGAATALAARSVTKRDLRAARRVNEGMASSLKWLDPVSFTQGNQDFHQILFQSCPNTHLLAAIEREWSRMAAIRRSSFAFVPERAAEAVSEHDTLLDLLGSRAGEVEVERFAREHRLATARALFRIYPTEFGQMSW